MAEPGPAESGGAGAAPQRRFLTFRVEQQRYAVPAEEVSEVIRAPAVARLPQSPKALLGVGNLRGAVLPVASARVLLGRSEAVADTASRRAIVLDGGAPVALMVDSVDALVSLAADQVETRQAELAARPGERLRGAFRSGDDAVRILDVRALLDSALARPTETVRAARRTLATAETTAEAQGKGARTLLVAFEVAGQAYALPMEAVQEIVDAPDALTRAPDAEALVLGVAAYRRRLLPVLSLRGLLGFPPAPEGAAAGKMIVALIGGAMVGLVADRVRSVLRADPAQIDPAPAMLAARAGGESRIKAIYRGDDGRRLVSILSPELLFREDVMQRLGRGVEPAGEGVADVAAEDIAQFLVFRLGDEEFGLPIEAVEEVARAPDKVSRMPRAPKFIEGVVNLRGEVLPVVDQRRRFDMPRFDGTGQRMIVVRTGGRRAGLLVDSVSQVLRTSREAIEPAPELAGEETRLVDGVVNLPGDGRMVLLLDPQELLTRAESGLLDAFAASQAGG